MTPSNNGLRNIRLLSKLKRMRQDQIKNERKTGVYMLINEDFE